MRRLLLLVCICVTVPAVAVAQAPAPPVATTQPARDVRDTTATLVATVDPAGADTTVRFEYGTSGAINTETGSTTVPSGAGATEVAIPVSGLRAQTTYDFRVVASNSAGATSGAVQTFRTTATPRGPDASTRDATSVTPYAATLVGIVTANGQPTKARFEYGLTSDLGSSTPEQDLGSEGSRTITATLEGLTPNVRVYFRVVASSTPGGDVRGGVRSFLTPRDPQDITFTLRPQPGTYTASTTGSGRVSGRGVSGVPVALEARVGQAWQQIGQTVQADSRGNFSFSIDPVLSPLRLRAVLRAVPTLVSPVRDLRVRPRVGLVVRRGEGSDRVFSGTVRPALPGTVVSLQRRAPRGKWVLIARRATSRGRRTQRYSFTVRVARRGAYRVISKSTVNGWSRGLSRERAVGGGS